MAKCLALTALISMVPLATAFRAPSAPFVFVQLPAYVRQNDTALAELREGQLAAADSLAGVGFACTADDGTGNGDIHNPNKSLVGRRMGAVVRALLYGETGVTHLSPRYASAAAATAASWPPSSWGCRCSRWRPPPGTPGRRRGSSN